MRLQHGPPLPPRRWRVSVVAPSSDSFHPFTASQEGQESPPRCTKDARISKLVCALGLFNWQHWQQRILSLNFHVKNRVPCHRRSSTNTCMYSDSSSRTTELFHRGREAPGKQSGGGHHAGHDVIESKAVHTESRWRGRPGPNACDQPALLTRRPRDHFAKDSAIRPSFPGTAPASSVKRAWQEKQGAAERESFPMSALRVRSGRM